MKPSQKSTHTVTLDVPQTHESDTDTVAYPDDLAPGYESETGAALCPACGDLLARHDQPCEATPTPQATADTEDETPPTHSPAPASTFAYAIGHRVQPAQSPPAAITWRGQHKERHPATGLVHRINVYYLDNGYWDCYREDELKAAII
jgi:hypothetical protein